MARKILIDEFHLGVFAQRGLSVPEQDAICRGLNDPAFQADLSRAIRRVFRRYPDLRKVRVRLSRAELVCTTTCGVEVKNRRASSFPDLNIKKEIDMTATMNTNTSAKAQRKTLAAQLDRLDDILDVLSDGLNEAVSSAVEGAVAAAVREGVQLAVVEVLTNPALLQRVREAAWPPETQPAQATPRPGPGRAAGLAAAASVAGGKAADLFRRTLAKGRELAVRCKVKLCSLASSGRSRLGILATRVRGHGRVLGALALTYRRPLALALGVGVVVGVTCYFAGPVVSATMSAAGAFAASALGAVLYPFRRLFLAQPVSSP